MSDCYFVILGPTQPPIQWLPGVHFLGVKWLEHLHLVPRSRICGTISPLSQYAFMAWYSVKAQGQLYLNLLQNIIHTVHAAFLDLRMNRLVAAVMNYVTNMNESLVYIHIML
jgi:hypothetical protein